MMEPLAASYSLTPHRPVTQSAAKRPRAKRTTAKVAHRTPPRNPAPRPDASHGGCSGVAGAHPHTRCTWRSVGRARLRHAPSPHTVVIVSAATQAMCPIGTVWHAGQTVPLPRPGVRDVPLAACRDPLPRRPCQSAVAPVPWHGRRHDPATRSYAARGRPQPRLTPARKLDLHGTPLHMTGPCHLCRCSELVRRASTKTVRGACPEPECSEG
jgi:hypothetical protein